MIDDRKEIGGYLGLDDFIHNEYYQNALSLNTARNALVYLCRAKNIKKLYIPYFLCDSVSNVCDRENIEYEYYHVDSSFLPMFSKKLKENEYLYIVNYYGQLSDDYISGLKNKYKNIIADYIQAFFTKPHDGVDTIYSCRKFFGVPDGAYLFTDAQNIDLEKDISKDRMRHIFGRYEGTSASEYYGDFKANDGSFVELDPKFMSKLTHNILGALDYEKIKARREENWRVLESHFGEENKLKLRMPEGPFMYPFYTENGMQIKKLLAQKKIFVPTLWPNVLSFDGCETEKNFSADILPLPIDQRYDSDDMKYIAEEIYNVRKS